MAANPSNCSLLAARKKMWNVSPNLLLIKYSYSERTISVRPRLAETPRGA